MATTTATVLSKKDFNTRVVSFIGKREISRLNAGEPHGSYRFDHTLETIQRYARYNEEDGIPYSFENICYGIRWSVETGRVGAQAVLAMRALKVSELIALVHEVGSKFDTIGDIPAYLIRKYTAAN